MDETIRDGIAQRIFDARVDMGIKQKELGIAIGLKPDTAQRIISNIEVGKRLPTLEELFSIAEVLQTDPVKLIFGVKKDNFDIAKELGLSDNSITILKHGQTSQRSWISEGMKQFENHPAVVVNAILSNISLIESIFGYIFSDFSTLDYYDPESEWHVGDKVLHELREVKAANVRLPFIADFESLYRVKLLDELKDLREELSQQREERINGLSIGKNILRSFIRHQDDLYWETNEDEEGDE